MQSRGEPQTIADLSRHSCLLIRERNETFGRWSLQGPDGTRNVRVSASLASNHGDVIRRWALEGHGARTRLCIRHLRARLRSGPFALAAPK
jgi:LysR family transcriptional activator of dmlA